MRGWVDCDVWVETKDAVDELDNELEGNIVMSEDV